MTALLVFLHIPKTAGMTLRYVLDRQYGAEAVFATHAERWREDIERLVAMTPEERARYRVVSGHMDYGLHERLPEPALYITMLRDPVARVASFYRFVRANSWHALHEHATRLPLAAFARAGLTPELDNLQARALAGVSESPAPATRETLERARKNLSRFAAFGIVERFDESLLLFRRVLGWRLPLYVRVNVTPGSEALPPEAVAAIEETNPLDLELYRESLAAFEERVTAAGGSLRAELAAYRALNAGYRALRRSLAAVTSS